MASEEGTKTAYQKWQQGLNKALGDTGWDAYDCEIKTTVSGFNRHLSGVAGYPQLDWLLIKAIVWTETGAANAEWKTKPMQIGVPGDPGLSSLLSENEGGELILPPTWRNQLTSGSVRCMPSHNIRAGVGYLLMRTAYFEFKSIPAEDRNKVHEVTVKGGDSLATIAKAQGSTPEILKKLNPTATLLRPGQVLKCQKGAVKRVITGWRYMTTTLIAQRYNGGGDANYGRKLDYALGVIRRGKVAVCA